jgi:putative phosphonate transport system ATP-binding protein
MTRPRPVLRVENLTKRFGSGCDHCDGDAAEMAPDDNVCPRCGTVWALRDISFELYANEIIGVIGESGAGKSTLLNILLGDQTPTSGEIFFSRSDDGERSILTATAQERRHLRDFEIGIVHQDPRKALYGAMTAGGNVVERLLAADQRNVGAMRRRATELLERMELRGRLDHKVGTFSSGMQQRVQIAKALANSPALLLLDEPTTGLDVCVQARTLDLLRQVQRETGVAMIIVTHDWNVLRLLARRAVILKSGRAIERGPVERLFEDPVHPYAQLLIHSSL